MPILSYLIIFLSVVNLFRMTMFLVGSDIYGLLHHLRNRKTNKKKELPKFSVVIPAHNEEGSVIRNIESIYANKYPQEKLEVIFVDDGSTDNTVKILQDYKKKFKLLNLKIISQEKSGKAAALNNGLRNYATGELVMCLDSDSYIKSDALRKASYYFEDPKVVALSANVKIIPNEGLLNLIQKFEYLICYQMKRAQTFFNIEYIIGGIGSTFRHSTLKQIGYYDGNTVTEDIDMTMKILQNGNKKQRVIYGADVIAYTESAISIKGLINQRFRWKYGRTQTFYKNKNLFFNTDNKFSKGLTFFYLPFAIFCDIAFLLEPIIIAYFIYLILQYGDLFTLLTAFLVISGYITINILAEDSVEKSEKLLLLAIAPTMYFLFYVLSYVEYIALIKSIIKLPQLKKSLKNNKTGWVHIARPKIKQAI